MYRDVYHPQIRKDIKKLDRSVTDEIKDKHIPAIIKNPSLGEPLAGVLEGIYSYHLKKNKVDYRITYWINTVERTVYFLMIGKRENFYKMLKNRI